MSSLYEYGGEKIKMKNEKSNVRWCCLQEALKLNAVKESLNPSIHIINKQRTT